MRHWHGSVDGHVWQVRGVTPRRPGHRPCAWCDQRERRPSQQPPDPEPTQTRLSGFWLFFGDRRPTGVRRDVRRCARDTSIQSRRGGRASTLSHRKRLQEDRYLSLLFRWSGRAISAPRSQVNHTRPSSTPPAMCPQAPTLLKEGIEGVPERLHGSGSLTEPASMVDDYNRIHVLSSLALWIS